jgi:hypothetical protein
MMIGMKGREESPLMRRVTSMPSMRGIMTSSSMRSGGEARTLSSASCPSIAWSTS